MSSAKRASSSKKTVKYKTYSVWRRCCMFCFSSLHGSWKSQSLICTLMTVKEELLLKKKKEKKVGTQQWQCPPTPTSVYFTPWRILLSQRTKTVKMLLGWLVYNDWGGCIFFLVQLHILYRGHSQHHNIITSMWNNINLFMQITDGISSWSIRWWVWMTQRLSLAPDILTHEEDTRVFVHEDSLVKRSR